MKLLKIIWLLFVFSFILDATRKKNTGKKKDRRTNEKLWFDPYKDKHDFIHHSVISSLRCVYIVQYYFSLSNLHETNNCRI